MVAVLAQTTTEKAIKRPSIWFFLFCMLSTALGWRIRGQFGHEIGASMAGALGAMALVLFSRRPDWICRIHYFALMGALGWGFGGSISYMKVVGYTHSSDSATVLYGFAGMLLIGFVWASLGAAATALPAVLDQTRLASLFPALVTVFVAWFLWDVGVDWIGKSPSTGYDLGVRIERQSGLAQYDTDWQEVTVAIGAVIALVAFRRRIDLGSSLILHLAIGWWLAFTVLVLLLGLRLNPPRGDNWAGCVGLMVFCWRHELGSVARTALVSGLVGTAGFCIGQTLKLTFLSGPTIWDWHAVMECIHGAFFGLALAIGMLPLLNSRPNQPEIAMPRWLSHFAIFFVVWMIPYLNIRRSPSTWLKNLEKLPKSPFDVSLVAGLLPSRGWVGWFDSLWLLSGFVLIALLVRHARRPVLLIPDNSTGKGQLLYLAFAWIITVMSFVHEIPNYNPIVLAMQWWVTANAILCTTIVLAWTPCPVSNEDQLVGSAGQKRTQLIVVISLFAALASAFAGWEVKRWLYDDRFARGFYMDHIRFGPNNTNDIR